MRYDLAVDRVPADPFSLRRATAADAAAIGAVFDAAVRAGWTFLGEAASRPMFAAEDWDRLVLQFQPPNALVVAVDARRRIIGYAAVRVDEGELFLLFVDPDHSGRGVGRALLNAAHDALKAAGRTTVFLFTEERNSRARAVYTAAGYRADGTVRESKVHGVPIRELRLVRPL
jgi:ribosomal protein S18 acetylase RimI-like enzyme